MKIVIAVEEFDPEKGYLEYYLAEELTKLGHKVYIFTFGWGKDTSRTMLNEGFEVVDVPHFAVVHGYHMPSFNGVAHTLKFIKAEKPDMIHCQPLDSPLSLIFIACKSIFRYKIVGSIMTQLNLFFSPWGIKKRMLFSLSRIVVANYVEKRCETIFAKNSELSQILSTSYGVPLDKFRVIPLGSDPDIYKFNLDARGQLRKKLGISESDVVLVYSGKVDSSKGLDILIRALAPLVTKYDRIKLLIIGEGEMSFVESLKKLITEFKIEKNVIFHPWIDKTLLPSFYSASDIGVWPGLSSTSIVDAASTGLPLIISRCPVETFAIDNENGFAFEIGNVQELQRYLEILIRDEKLRKEMGRKSRLLVEQSLNWESITSKYMTAYKSTSGKLK